MSYRTTLTLDDDVAAKLAAEARRSGRSYRAVVNDALRRGLEGSRSLPEAYRVDARPMNLRSMIGIDDVEATLELVDGPDRR